MEGAPGRCLCTTACASEAAQAEAKQMRSPAPLTGTNQAPLLTCSLLRAGVLEGPCCLVAGGDCAPSASSALSADSACRQATPGGSTGLRCPGAQVSVRQAACWGLDKLMGSEAGKQAAVVCTEQFQTEQSDPSVQGQLLNVAAQVKPANR